MRLRASSPPISFSVAQGRAMSQATDHGFSPACHVPPNRSAIRSSRKPGSIWSCSSVMKAGQKHMISVSDRPCGSKSTPPLAPAHRQPGERVLDHLLEGEPLEEVLADLRMETQAALVGADRVGELNAVAAVDLHAARVVRPYHAEDQAAIGPDDALGTPGLEIAGPRVHEIGDAAEEPLDAAQEAFLLRRAALEASREAVGIEAVHQERV